MVQLLPTAGGAVCILTPDEERDEVEKQLHEVRSEVRSSGIRGHSSDNLLSLIERSL